MRGEPISLQVILDNWIRPLHELMVVCLGRSVRLNRFLVRAPGAEAGREPMLRVSFAAVQASVADAPTVAQVGAYNAPTLLTPRTTHFPISALLEGWFCAYGNHRHAITLLTGPYHAPFTYAEHRFTSQFQAAERLAKDTLDASELPKVEHKARVDLVMRTLSQASIDPDLVEWVGRLTNRNDKQLRQLILELANDTGAIGRALTDTAPEFAKQAAGVRGGASHGAAAKTDSLRRYWLAEALGWITRVRLLTLAGVPLADLEKTALKNARFRRMLNELQ